MENWLEKRIALSPDKTAIVTKEDSLTYRELGKRVEIWMRHLATVIEKDSFVGVLVNNSLMGYITILALQQLNCTLVMLNKRLSADELQFQINDTNLKVVIYEDGLLKNKRLTKVNCFSFTAIENLAVTPVAAVADFKDEHVTTLMYTSGTTRKPKGVCQTFRNHFYSAVGSAFNLGISTDDNWLCVVPLFHISGFSIMMRALLYGMTVTLVNQFDAKTVNKILVENKISAISVVPTMLQQLIINQNLQKYNPKFRFFLLGGGPIDLHLLEICQKRNWPVIQSYGMTETASQVVALNFEDAQQKIGSVGKPLFPVALKIATDGEILLNAPNITPGYYQLPLQNKTSFENGWFKTGDIGYLDKEGFLYLRGRKGDMIISGGENIFPDEIEAVYYNLKDIVQIVVAGVPDSKWGSVPVAFIQTKGMMSKSFLRDYGYQHLAHFKVPHRFYLVSDYPRTASGKIKRQYLSQHKQYFSNELY